MAGPAAIILGSIAAATGLAGMGIGLGQAGKQRRAASQAKADSERLMQQARNRVMADNFENIKLPTESYDRAFRENTAQQRQAIDSLQSADARTLAAGIGKVSAAGTAANEEQRLVMGKDLYDLELKKAQNAEAIKNELVGMDVGQARDLTTMSADSREAAAASTMGAIQSGVAGVSALASSLPDYFKGAGDRKAGIFAESDAFKNMDKGGNVVIDKNTGKAVQTDNPDYLKRADDYNMDLKPGEQGYIAPTIDYYQSYTDDEAKKLIGENYESIFGDNKTFRELKKNDFKDLTPAQLAKIKEILGQR
tara:strand:+ start:10975 stop:11898 length:924 start_codon:yes stop_codon:yes gene_type:complete